MKILKNKKFIISISSLFAILLIACLSYGIVASWLTKETLQSSVEISLLLQGDEADIYESPVNLTSKGTYELSKIGTKDKDGNYVGNDVGVGEAPEPSRKNFYDYVMPGVNIPKDPKVFITKKSGAPAYLYIEVYEDNFPEYFTEEGFEELGVNNPEQNPNEVKPVYYDLEDYWVPVYTEEGEHALGVNKGKLYVYYNTGDYFQQYSKIFSDDTDGHLDAATYLSSYIMKDESTGVGKIDKQQYYGTNEVKTVNGSPMDCPYFNILKKDTVYISEGYIHPEYYSTLYSELAKQTGTVTKEGHDFGLYFFSYMASAKIDGEYTSPFEAYEKAGFMEEEEYLRFLYESKDESDSVAPERIVYVWEDHLYTKQEGNMYDKDIHDAVKDYFGDGLPYKVVLMESLDVESTIKVSATSDFVFDMNGKTITASPTGTYESALWKQTYDDKTKKSSNVTIRGNGKFYMESCSNLDTVDMFWSLGKITIEDGSYIREYNPKKNQETAFNGSIVAATTASATSIVIKGGYFDNGYWDLANGITSNVKWFDLAKNKLRLLPLYDTNGGRGWLMADDGSYLRIDPKGNIYKVPIDENGNHQYTKVQIDGKDLYKCKSSSSLNIFKDEKGYYIVNTTTVDGVTTTENIYLEYVGDRYWEYEINGETKTIWKIYPERGDFVIEKYDNQTAYVRVLDDEGNWIMEENGKYKLEAVDSFDKTYGPDPYGIPNIITATGGCYDQYVGRYRVYGGTFVVQNPAWGDELSCSQIYAESSKFCPEDYNPQRFFNPWFQMWYTNGWDNVFLDAQIPWQDEGIPKGYNITESSTQYTYEDENGETKAIYVPTYTVNYSGEIPD